MKKGITIIFTLIILSSCKTIVDYEFKKCYDSKLKERVTFMGPVKIDKKIQLNIHQIFETYLIENQMLSNNTKNGYKDLIIDIKNNVIEKSQFEKFKTKIGFDPILHFNPYLSTQCFGELFEIKKKLNNTDWQYDFLITFNKFEEYGEIEYLSEMLEKIPDDKFIKIEYRKLFIDLIFSELEYQLIELDNKKM